MTKVATPPLPKLVLQRVPVETPRGMNRRATGAKIEHDVVAKTPRGRVLKRWAWWDANRPRKRSAKFMVLDGQRYEIEHDVAKAEG